MVPKDSTITLTFKVDTPVLDYELNSNGSGVASSLEGIQLTLNAAGDVTAKGAQSGNSVATPTLSNAQGNNMYLVRSVPKITLNETGGTFAASTAPKDMHTFTVSADSSGDVGLFAVSYGVSTSSATITEAYLYESGTKVASFVSTSSPIMNNFTDGASPEWEGILTFVLTTDGAVPNNAFNPSRSPSNVLPTNAVIGAGSTRTYTLKGTIECANECLGASNTGTVVVRFLSDSAAVGTSPTTTKALYESGTTVNYNVSLLWTDFWRTPGGRSSTTATITEQWINGYLLKNSSGNYLETTSTGATWSKASQ